MDVDVWRPLLVAFCSIMMPVAASSAPRLFVVCYGDSITAGYGLSYGQSYPDDLQRLLDARGYRYTVRNMGSSGATTEDAVADLPNVLRLHPAVVIVEFGGNDGLRGLPLEKTRANLDLVITALQKAHIQVLLAGITLPPNYGQDYIEAFDRMFRAVAAADHAALVPMIYKNLIHVPGTIQGDGIHPTAKGSEIVAETLMPALRPLLEKR